MGAQKVKQIKRRLTAGIDPKYRAALMVRLLNHQPADVFWPVFIWLWPACHSSWGMHKKLLRLLRHNAVGIDLSAFMGDEARQLFSALPDCVQVYRGCPRGHELGISWTLDRKEAVWFARSRGELIVHDPVVCEATIPKTAIFTVIPERDEAEVVLDPAELSIVATLALSREEIQQ